MPSILIAVYLKLHVHCTIPLGMEAADESRSTRVSTRRGGRRSPVSRRSSVS